MPLTGPCDARFRARPDHWPASKSRSPAAAPLSMAVRRRRNCSTACWRATAEWDDPAPVDLAGRRGNCAPESGRARSTAAATADPGVGRAAAALRHSVRGQGQHRRRRPADHRRLPGVRLSPARSAPVVERLIAAGAIPIGKTNLDQFATGLVGTRSPYGVPRNPFDAAFIPGGSSSGSAVAVAAGLVSFALGTDTAGSGRVPAAFNNIVGLKPTRGLLSTRGMVPACRSLDCVSIFALTVRGCRARCWQVAQGSDPEDVYSRPAAGADARRLVPATFRFGVPATATTSNSSATGRRRLFARRDARLGLGGTARRDRLHAVSRRRPSWSTAALAGRAPRGRERFHARAARGIPAGHPRHRRARPRVTRARRCFRSAMHRCETLMREAATDWVKIGCTACFRRPARSTAPPRSTPIRYR